MKPAFKRRNAGGALLLALSLLIPAGCAGAVKKTGEAAGSVRLSKRVVSARAVANEAYRLQPADELEILLSSQTASGVRVQIQEDGSAFYPSIGLIQMANKTLLEIEKEIQNHLDAEKESTPGSGGPAPSNDTEEITPQQALNQLYHIQPGDQLDISVWEYGDLNQKILVREDGSFIFPLIGTVSTNNRTISRIEQEITERLNRDYIVNPQVTARLTGAQFSILGMKSGESGNLPLDSSMDLVTALSKAGDIDTLRSSRVEIIRRVGEKRYSIKTDVDRVLRGKEPNIQILPRDTIYLQIADAGRITLRLVGAKFTALGELMSPGVHPVEGPMDILTAVSLAGGITKFGSSKVEIIRARENERLVIRIDIDRVLKGKDPNLPIFPRDTIYVKRRLF